ncbi:MAG TPA: GNAT family N-acetyltransferase [Acidimicrobiales bacterium]|nr:GNAT family N-acetyltransferase [Acidimicrobiales bacterium]
MSAGTGAAPGPASAVVVREVDPATDPRWDAYVGTHPAASAYHRSAWLRVLATEYDQPLTALAGEDAGGRIAGVLPLVRTRGIPFGIGGALGSPRLCSLPRTPAAGPVADHPAATAALLEAGVRRAEALGVRVQLKPVTSDLDGLVPELVGVPWRLTYVLHMPSDPEACCFDSRRRERRLHHLVRKAEADGVSVETGSFADLDDWYRLYLDAMRLHAQPARPRRLFQALLAACEADPAFGRLSVAVVRDGGARRVVAGIFVLNGTETTSYAFTGLDRGAAARSHPVDALVWDAIHRSHAAGLRRFDLGEVPNGHEALATFKLKWGTTPEPVRRYYWPPIPPEEVAETGPSPGSGSRAVAAWRRVPLPVTALAGRIVHRYL